MVSDEVVHFGVPLAEHRFTVWIAANLHGPLSEESLDVLICDGVQSLHDGPPEQSRSYDLAKDHGRNDEEQSGNHGDPIPVKRVPPI